MSQGWFKYLTNLTPTRTGDLSTIYQSRLFWSNFYKSFGNTLKILRSTKYLDKWTISSQMNSLIILHAKLINLKNHCHAKQRELKIKIAFIYPSPSWPICNLQKHDTIILFNRLLLPTNLTSMDIWPNPSGTAPLLAAWKPVLSDSWMDGAGRAGVQLSWISGGRRWQLISYTINIVKRHRHPTSGVVPRPSRHTLGLPHPMKVRFLTKSLIILHLKFISLKRPSKTRRTLAQLLSWNVTPLLS